VEERAIALILEEKQRLAPRSTISGMKITIAVLAIKRSYPRENTLEIRHEATKSRTALKVVRVWAFLV
jgi:hypothetical protein